MMGSKCYGKSREKFLQGEVGSCSLGSRKGKKKGLIHEAMRSDF